MQKILSIIIPTYNMERLLPRCLDSLITPSCPESLEVLVVNDGSKDSSLEVAREYERTYPGIVRVIDKKNGNYGSAVNAGIEYCHGKYVRILDADDLYNHEGLISLLEALSTLDVDMVLTNYCSESGMVTSYFNGLKERHGQISDLRNLSIEEFPNYAMHGITFRSSILKENDIRLLEGISYTDTEFIFYPLQFVRTFVFLDVLVYRYQLGREGQTVEISSRVKGIANMEKIIDRMHNYLTTTRVDKEVYEKQRFIFCYLCTFFFMTVLCFDKSGKHLVSADNVLSKVRDIDGAEAIMMSKSLYGIPFYRRYVLSGRQSSSTLFRLYYRAIAEGKRILARILGNLRR